MKRPRKKGKVVKAARFKANGISFGYEESFSRVANRISSRVEFLNGD